MGCRIGGRDGTDEAFQGGPGARRLPPQADYPIFRSEALGGAPTC
jgi:hypothetical protein